MKNTLKITIAILFVLFTNLVNAQTEFKYELTEEVSMLGLHSKLNSNFIIVEAEGKNGNELYYKVLNYINEVYKNPEEVIVAKTEGEFIKINGRAGNIAGFVSLGILYPLDTRYSISYFFKDGKYKFELTSVEVFYTGGQYSKAYWAPYTSIPTHTKKSVEKPNYIAIAKRFENYFNELALSPLSQVEVTKQDW